MVESETTWLMHQVSVRPSKPGSPGITYLRARSAPDGRLVVVCGFSARMSRLLPRRAQACYAVPTA
jgi:hypothetical protein